jgi:putative FmdB family regulatory protein
MPIYEYRCMTCGQKSEMLISNPANTGDLKCHACGSCNLAKLISIPGLTKERTGSGKTCCGREERCDKPPCDADNHCHRDH